MRVLELKTPLYDRHVALGGKIVPFAGYLLPVQYSGVIQEHMAVREKAGLFDVSHMGEIMLEGPDSVKTLNHLLTNDYTEMPVGRCRYSLMCNDKGGVIDDLIVYKYSDEKYLLVVNAANRQKDAQWMRTHLVGKTTLLDISDEVAQIALQGPISKEIITKLVSEDALPDKYYTFKANVPVSGIDCIISRTGYTGEFGYEFYLKNSDAPLLWDILLDTGGEYGLIPCGLGARDTLRLEAAMPLYGHEMDETTDPLEAGLDFAVKLSKPEFIGRDALLERGEPKRVRAGLKVTGRGIVRESCDLYSGDALIGRSTSGTHCPYLGGPFAMAIVDRSYSEPGTTLEADVRGRRISVEIIPLPFYKKN